MCGRSKTDPTVLERRQNGLDSRGNVPAHTRAESEWATTTFKNMDPATTTLLADDIKNLYAKAGQVNGKINNHCVKKFKKGVLEIFGDQLDREPSAEQLSALMFEGKYGFKDATDAINREQKATDANLYNQGRSGKEFAGEKGRRPGPTRKNSFSNTDSGITDRVNRDDTSRDFFGTKTVHAKGMLEGDDGQAIYKDYKDAEAPFIGGASGTMQGLIMGMEMRKPRDQLSTGELKEREKLIGVHMAALINGGHHSASECLIAAKKYGYFANVTDPLTDYTDAMDELGVRLTAVGLPTDLSAKQTAVGDPWRKAVIRLHVDLNGLRAKIRAEYEGRKLKAAPLVDEFDVKIETPLKNLFPHTLAHTLDGLPATKDDDNQRSTVLTTARDQIRTLKTNLKNDLVSNLEKNPFKPLAIQARLEGVLDLLLKEVVGPA